MGMKTDNELIAEFIKWYHHIDVNTEKANR